MKRMKCDMAVQTEVALQKIGYVYDLGPHMKVAWAWFQTVIRKSDMGHIWAKKLDLGHFSLQCELSLSWFMCMWLGLKLYSAEW